MRTRAPATAATTLALLTVVGAVAAEPAPGLPARIRVLVPLDERPEIFALAETERPGLARELVEGFCRIHGLAFEVVPVPDPEQIIPMLLAGEGDVIPGLVATRSRRQQVAFTSEVVPVRHVAVTRRSGPFLSREEDLHALRVGVIPGTTWGEEATRVPGSRRVAYRDLEALVEGLRGGESDAAVMTVLDFALARNRDAGLVAGPFVGPFSSAALAVRREDKPLLGALNGYLEGMPQARHALMFKYLSEEALSLIALARED